MQLKDKSMPASPENGLTDYLKHYRLTDFPKQVVNPLSYYSSDDNPAASKVALIDGSECISYFTLEALVLLCAQRLRQMCTKDDVLVVFGSNSAWELVVIWAAISCGIKICPINPKLPADKLKAVLDNIQAGCFWVENDSILSQEAKSALIGLREFVYDHKPAEQALASVCTQEDKLAIIRAFAPSDAPQENLSSLPVITTDSICTLILTSGSTGIPKAVAATYKNHFASARGADMLSAGDVYLQSLPLYHIGGLAISMRCFFSAATVMFSNPQSSIEQTLARSATLGHPVTCLSVVPTQLHRMLQQHYDFSQSAIRRILLGGGPITADLLRQCLAQQIYPYVSYGLSEMCSQVCTRRITSPEMIADLNAGVPLPYRQLKISNQEILVKGDTLFAGYYCHGRLELPVDQEGYFHTADLGALNERQELYVFGRRDNQFVSGGENIQPEPIEKIICEESGAARALLYGHADEEWGSMAVAVTDGNLDGLRAKLKARLAPYEVPKIILPWPQDNGYTLKVSRQDIISYAEKEIKRLNR